VLAPLVRRGTRTIGGRGERPSSPEHGRVGRGAGNERWSIHSGSWSLPGDRFGRGRSYPMAPGSCMLATEAIPDLHEVSASPLTRISAQRRWGE